MITKLNSKFFGIKTLSPGEALILIGGSKKLGQFGYNAFCVTQISPKTEKWKKVLGYFSK